MSTSTLREALRKRYAMPEWVLMEEVRDAAGFESNRSADGIAMSMWPSRGLEINGFEIKASRSDWLRELKDPAKAESIAAYCDRWWIVAVPNIVKLEELPVGWGLMELMPKGAFKEIKKAPARENVKPLNRSFVAAMMRRVGEIDELAVRIKVEQAMAASEKQRQQWATQEVERRTTRAKEMTERLEKIKEATGLDLMNWSFNDESFIAAVRYAMKEHDIRRSYCGIESIKNSMTHLIRQIEELKPLVFDDKKEAA